MSEKEVWLPVQGYEGLYEVSNLGNVKRLSRISKNSLGRDTRLPELIMKPIESKKQGYFRIGTSKDGRHKMNAVHRLVALAFIPNPENKPQVNHKDGDKGNNKLDNLEWCTAKENKIHAHQVLKIKMPQGEGASGAKYSEVFITKILDLRFKGGLRYTDISAITSVHKDYIGLVCRGERWSELFTKYMEGGSNEKTDP